jgi:hypothetical protein
MAGVVLEQLKAIRTKLDDHGDRLGRIETRLSSIEHPSSNASVSFAASRR